MNEIRISHLEKAYDKKAVLKDFSAVLEPGRITALMAPSGSGKTTLLRILMGLETPDRGTVTGMDGIRISAVFQEDRLCEALTPSANIRLVDPAHSAEEIRQALAGVGLGDCLNQPVRELSGGMRRRVAILRALLAPYELLLLDEPFQGLDRNTKNLVIRDTCRRCQGRTVLLVTHDASELEAMGIEACLTINML